MCETIPWIEKYRPSSFDGIILSSAVRKILSNIIPLPHKDVPNLLFFGPPGTGKTTTIMRWISLYHSFHSERGKDLVMHLNASDERGLDTIRERIEKFAISGNLFGVGMKFIIMDEFDAMTPSAQYAFKEVVSSIHHDIRFVVICNYIHRIERTIRDEFMNIEFTSIPKDETMHFLEMIVEKEGLSISNSTFNSIYSRFVPDIRSMINYIQSNRLRFTLSEKWETSPINIHKSIPLSKDPTLIERNNWLLEQLPSNISDAITVLDNKTFFPIILKFSNALQELSIHCNIGIRELLNGIIRQLSENLVENYSSQPAPIQDKIYSFLEQLKTLNHSTISLPVLQPACCLLFYQIQNFQGNY